MLGTSKCAGLVLLAISASFSFYILKSYTHKPLQIALRKFNCCLVAVSTDCQHPRHIANLSSSNFYEVWLCVTYLVLPLKEALARGLPYKMLPKLWVGGYLWQIRQTLFCVLSCLLIYINLRIQKRTCGPFRLYVGDLSHVCVLSTTVDIIGGDKNGLSNLNSFEDLE